ncbi:MAG: substrate-binding domain-containing protein [Thermomicrobiales bacterium]|nr:substrate-binding domain-containing protein [Thermomicrobiales bacterium]
MSTCRSASGKASRRSILKASVIAGAGMTLITPFGWTAKAQDDGYTIAFIQGVIGDNFYITMDCGARAKAEALGNVTIDTQGPERFDQTLQTPILNAVVQSKPDAIMMAPNDAKGMIAPIQAAIDAGIPVLCVDTTIDSDIQLGDVATDNVEGGRLAARGLAEQIGGKGKVFVVNVKPGISTTDLREQGFREAIEQEFPDIEYLGQEYCDNDSNIAAQIVSARLQSDPDLSGIFGTNLFAAQGAAAALRQQNLQGTVKMVGFDAGPTQVQDLKSETVDLLIAQHPGDIGEIAVGLLAEYLASGVAPDPKELVTGSTIVTRDNIDDPEVARYLYVADCGSYQLANAEPLPQAGASSEAEATPGA